MATFTMMFRREMDANKMMEKEKRLLTLPVIFVIFYSILKTAWNVYQELDESGEVIFAAMFIFYGEESVTALYVTEETIAIFIVSYLKSTLLILLTEFIRSLIQYVLVEQRSIHVTMTYRGSENQEFVSFYWKVVQRYNPGRISYEYMYDDDEEYTIEYGRFLHTLVITYDGKTGKARTSYRHRMFEWY